MNSHKLFFGLLASLLILAVGGAGILVQGQKVLTNQNDRLTALKVESTNLEHVQKSLVEAKKDVAEYSPIELISKTVVPQEKDQAKTVREIIKLASDLNISIASVTFPSSNLGTKPAAGATQAPVTAVTQTQKVEGINNVERLEITVTSETSKSITYNTLLQFLAKLEQNRRTSQVSSVNIQPLASDRNRVTFTLVLNVYIKK